MPRTEPHEDRYRRLARHLDDLPGGFPSTDSGVELRILRRLFTGEEADLAVHLTLHPEEAQAIAGRLQRPLDEVAFLLENMAKKGLIYRLKTGDRPVRYMAAQFVIGIWEFHVNDLEPELIRDMEEYIPAVFDMEVWKRTPQLRTIPIQESVPVKHEVMSYESAEELVNAHEKFLVAPCICRREQKMIDKGCRKPEEVCLVLGNSVHYYLDNGLGRLIGKEEVFEILKRANKAGLVLQPSNSKKVVNICCCCGCCCAVLRTVKKHPKPASVVWSPCFVSYDSVTCNGCGACLKRCQMDAIAERGEKVAVNLDRCIGCGLCVSACPTGSLRLKRKPESEQPDIPDNHRHMFRNLSKTRRKLKCADPGDK